MTARRPLALVGASIALIGLMAWLVPLATLALGPARGLLVSFAVYWFAFCLPLGFVFQGRDDLRRNLRLPGAGHGKLTVAVAAQGVIVAGASLALLPEPAPLATVGLALLFGAINGFCEEIFWRGAFLEVGRGSAGFQALGLALFTLWHIPLYLAHGVTFEGGALGLIGGSLFLGAMWTFAAYRTGRIGLCVLAHCFVNSVTFIGFLAANFFP